MSDIAPYPRTEGDVSAENLARYVGVNAWGVYRAADKGVRGDDWTRASVVVRLVDEWSIVFLLKQLQDRLGRAEADAIAQRMWLAWEDGDAINELLAQWVAEWSADGGAPEPTTAAEGQAG